MSPVQDMDDLIAYLFSHTSIGQTVTLSIIRDGNEMELPVTLQARPSSQTQQVMQETRNDSADAYLGVIGRTLTADIAGAMDLDEDQSGRVGGPGGC